MGRPVGPEYFRFLESIECRGGEVGRYGLRLRRLSTSDQGSERRAGNQRYGKVSRDLEEAARWQVEMYCRYLQFGHPNSTAAGAEEIVSVNGARRSSRESFESARRSVHH